MSKKEKAKYISLALLVMALWGSLFAFVKWDMLELSISSKNNPFDSILFAGLRFLIAGALLLFVALIYKRKEKPITSVFNSWRSLLSILFVGLFGFALHYAFTYLGLEVLDSSKTALIKQAGVLVFVCFSFLFFQDDKFSVYKIIGGLLGAASIAIVNMNAFGSGFPLESFYVLGASFCTVIANVAIKKLNCGVSSFLITGFSMLFGGLLLTTIGFALGGRIGTLNLVGSLIFIYIVLATIISYGIWYAIAEQYELSKLFIIKMAEPLFAAIVSICIPSLHTKLGYEHLIAFVLVALAVFVSNFKFSSIKKKEVVVDEGHDCQRE